jgi:hypothetical protein
LKTEAKSRSAIGRSTKRPTLNNIYYFIFKRITKFIFFCCSYSKMTIFKLTNSRIINFLLYVSLSPLSFWIWQLLLRGYSNLECWRKHSNCFENVFLKPNPEISKFEQNSCLKTFFRLYFFLGYFSILRIQQITTADSLNAQNYF